MYETALVLAISVTASVIIARLSTRLLKASASTAWLYAGGIAAASVCIYLMLRPFLPVSTASDKGPPPVNVTPSWTAMSLLDGKVVAATGESCARQGIRLEVEEKQLVAYPRNGPPISHEIEGQDGRALRLRLGDRLVFFDIKDGGFIHLDQGYERWLRFCE